MDQKIGFITIAEHFTHWKRPRKSTTEDGFRRIKYNKVSILSWNDAFGAKGKDNRCEF